MAREVSKLMVGLFTVIGIIIAVVIIVWVGATKYFEKGDRYVTYFDESVQGLQRDSDVKYRGVEVGRVEQIRVAPDNKLIGVVMKINLRDDLSLTTVAQLKIAGITGIVFVELDRSRPEDREAAPKLTFPAEYPVIPSRPSEIQKILAGVNVVVDKFTQIDTRGVFDQLKSTAAEIEIFFRGKRMDSILAKVEATLANLQQITARTDQLLAAGKVDAVLVEAAEAMKGARVLMAYIGEEMRGLNLRETFLKARSAANEIDATVVNLRRSSETLEGFLERIKDRPPDLIFGKPPRGRWNEK